MNKKKITDYLNSLKKNSEAKVVSNNNVESVSLEQTNVNDSLGYSYLASGSSDLETLTANISTNGFSIAGDEIIVNLDYSNVLNAFPNSSNIDFSDIYAWIPMRSRPLPYFEVVLKSVSTGVIITRYWNDNLDPYIKINLKAAYDYEGCINLIAKNSLAIGYLPETVLLVAHAKKTYTNMAIKTPPSKLVYNAGEEFDATGLSLSLITNLNTTESVNYGFSVTPRLLSAETTFVIVKYQNLTTEINVTVIDVDNDPDDFTDRNRVEVINSKNVTSNLDLNTGEVISIINSIDSNQLAIPLDIKHVQNKKFHNSLYGNKYNLNLNIKLERSNLDDNTNTIYSFTDEVGDVHTLEEKYYYIVFGEKHYVAKDECNISVDGTITYNNYEVKKEQSNSEYTLIPEIDDYINEKYIEERSEEQVQLEQQIKNYESTLIQYVNVDSTTGEIIASLDDLDESGFKTLINDVEDNSVNILLTRSEAINLKSLYSNLNQYDLQKKQIKFEYDQIEPKLEGSSISNQYDINAENLVIQKDQYILANRQFILQKSKMSGQERDLDLTNKYLLDRYPDIVNYGYPTGETDEKFMHMNNQINYYANERNRSYLKKPTNEIHDENDNTSDYNFSIKSNNLNNQSLGNVEKQIKLNDFNRSQLNKQKSMIDEQLQTIEEQLVILNEQIAVIISRAKFDFDTIKEYFDDYFKKQQLLLKYMQETPVNYLKTSSNMIYGFNEDGYLCVIYDSYNNYVAVKRENEKIISISDSKDVLIDFNYNNNLLDSIVDNLGHSTKFGYTSGNLSSVKYNDKTMTIAYSGSDIIDFVEDNIYQYSLTYTSSRLSKVLCNSLISNVGIEGTTSGLHQLSLITISYDSESTTLKSMDNSYTTYYFYTSGRISKKIECDAKKFIKTENYSYSKDEITCNKTIEVNSSTNTGDIPSNVTYVYDNNKKTLLQSTAYKKVSSTTYISSDIEYSYDEDNHLILEKTTVNTKINDVVSSKIIYTKYVYNASSKLVIKTQYVDTEEYLNGKNVEEYIYDENGNLIKTVSYNSLDSSTRFISTTHINDKGQKEYEMDELGQHKTMYEYKDNTNLVSSISYPSGLRLAYGLDNGIVTSVTRSTEQLEANTSNIIFRADFPVFISSNNNEYAYTYDYKGRITEFKNNNILHSAYAYTDYANNGNNVSFGSIVHNLYNNVNTPTVFKTESTGVLDGSGKYIQTIKKYFNGNTILTDVYNTNGKITSSNDTLAGVITTYAYDTYNNPSTIVKKENGISILNQNYIYNDLGKVSAINLNYNNANHAYNFNYKDDSTQSLNYISYKNYQFCPKQDKYGRTIGNSIKTTNSTIEESRINYCKLAANSSNRISSIYYANNGITNTNIKCSYDSMGNVTKITTDGKLTVRYTYDTLSRVIREDNKELNKTILIAYDDCGNILNKISTPFTLGYPEEQEIISESKYQYNKDVLVNYNGSAIAYDNIGNPLSIGSTTLSWTQGTLLAKYGNNTFTYDASGRRLSKNDINYLYDAADKLIYQSNGISFIYNESNIIGFTYNSNDYFYRRDVLGNIINIIDFNGNKVIQYKYDAWGNHEIFDRNNNLITDISNIGYINPIRYKGYYFDVETGLYYCMTRYYSPQMGRWISPDSIDYLDEESINGLNLYAYCLNNPVAYYDPSGHFAIGAFLIGLAVSSLVTWGLSEIFGSQIAGGIGSVSGGGTAISTGIGLLSFGPVGWISGGVLILIGSGTMVFGVNEIVAGATGTNYLQKWTGMSDEIYNGLYIGLNVASAVGSIAGNVYMRYADVIVNKSVTSDGNKLSRYSLVDKKGLKQYSYYDSKGNLWYQKDFRHGGAKHKYKFPHYHGFSGGKKLDGHWTFWELIKWLMK